MQKEPRRKRVLRQGRQAILQKPCQDGNLKFGIQKQTKAIPVHRNVGIFSLSKHLIFFWKKQTRFFLINQEYSWLILKKHDENKSVKKLRRCVIFYSLILLLYITLYNFPKKKRNLLTNKNIKTFVCWKLLHKYAYSSDF